MSKQPDYNPRLEGAIERSHAQPNGVSEDPRNEGWGHRTEMELVDSKKRKSISQRVNENRDGEEEDSHKKNHGKCGGNASNENDDALVDEGKSTKEKYADKYGDY